MHAFFVPVLTTTKKGIHNAEVVIREDATQEEFIDVVVGRRKYMKCLYVRSNL